MLEDTNSLDAAQLVFNESTILYEGHFRSNVNVSVYEGHFRSNVNVSTTLLCMIQFSKTIPHFARLYITQRMV